MMRGAPRERAPRIIVFADSSAALELEDYARPLRAAATSPEQEPEDEPATYNHEASAGGQERHHGATLGRGGGGALLDLLGRRRPLDDLLEVPQVLLHHQLGVGD